MACYGHTNVKPTVVFGSAYGSQAPVVISLNLDAEQPQLSFFLLAHACLAKAVVLSAPQKNATFNTETCPEVEIHGEKIHR